jgi:Uma2 family endonuclease
VVIVEVLSPSTEAEDRGVKLPAYRRLTSVQDILLVASDRPAVEHYVRQGRQWVIVDRGPGETVKLTALPVAIAIDELYADLGLDEAPLASSAISPAARSGPGRRRDSSPCGRR